ncbi:MAG TPA: ferritin-like domain-containing protein [Flavobacterium sp.]|jgi:hypothetical protein
MNIIKFIESFTDENLLHQQSSRRHSFSQFGQLGKKAAAAALPGGLLSLIMIPQRGSANILSTLDDATPIQALQLALTLEYLDSNFYEIGLSTDGLIPEGRDKMVFERLVTNENVHKSTLITALGGASSANFIPEPNFDYTAGGMFDPFNNYDQFLAMAQAFEDTGVRAYKGQAHNLMSDQNLLTTALQIHSAESRQAAAVRMLRNEKGWITANQRGAGVPEAVQPVYNGEEMTTQMNINIATLSNGSAGPALMPTAASQAFDEPLTRDQVLAIAGMYIDQP